MRASFLLLVFISDFMFFSSGGLPYSQLVHDQVCQEVVAPGAVAGQRLRINHPVTVTIISVIIFVMLVMWKLVINLVLKAVKKDLDVSSSFFVLLVMWILVIFVIVKAVSSGKLPAQTIASRAGRDS